MGDIPEEMNSIEITGMSKIFGPDCCRWYQKNQRKPARDINKKTKSPKVKNGKTICLTLNREHYRLIKSKCLCRSVEMGKLMDVNDVIREALLKVYPLEK